MENSRELLERARRSAEEARRVSEVTARLLRKSREIQHWKARVQGRVPGKSESEISFHSQSNQLLGLLPPAEFERLVPLLQGVRFRPRQVLQHANETNESVYFPLSGLLSAVIVMRDGSSIEVALIGNEGMAGLTAALGNGKSPYEVVAQIPGEALRIEVAQLRTELKQNGALARLLVNYQSVSAAQSAFQVACNGLHSVDKRCCGRLLRTQDQIGDKVLPLTNDSLALSLGVRRATVTDGLRQLQSRGIIACTRGRITILNRSWLQSRACECYQAIRGEYARLQAHAYSIPRADVVGI